MRDEPDQIMRYLRVITSFKRIFLKITNCPDTALFLSQAWWWYRNSTEPNGAFWKTRTQWERETGLNRFRQETSRKNLKVMGILFEPKMKRGQAQRYIVNENVIIESIKAWQMNTKARYTLNSQRFLAKIISEFVK